MKYIYVYILLVTFLFSHNRHSNVPIALIQPDNSVINCFISGDEYYHWFHDENGYTIIQSDKDGYYYYAIQKFNDIKISRYRVDNVNPEFLGLTPNIKISKQQYNQLREEYWQDVEERDAPSIGTINNLNVLIRFSDEEEFTASRSSQDILFNDEDGPSLYDYFFEVSYELLSVNTSHYPICDMDTNLSYQDEYPRDYYKPYNEFTNPIGYQNNNQARIREHTLLKNAIEFIADEVPPDLDIDANDDGYVDNVTFLVKGSPGDWADLLWPHRWALYSFDVFVNGSRVYDYNLNLEQGGYFTVGTLCHEFFHSLGAPDLYHYYDDIAPVAVGGWDVMDASSDIPQSMGAYMKYQYTDWINDLPIIEYGGNYEINPLSSSENNIYRINSPMSNSEYFVIEYRVKEGIYEINTPGDDNGLLIYRINSEYSGNANGPPDEVYLYRVGGTSNSSGSFGAAVFSSEVGRTQFNDMTDPSCFLTDGSNGGINISSVGEPLETMQFFVTNLILVPDLNDISFDTDGDGNVNPGEEIIIDIEVSNFSDDIAAYDISGILSSEDDIEIINSEITFSNILLSDDSIIGSYVININSDIELGEIKLNLNLTADYIENNQTLHYNNETEISIDVTLNQAEFPFYTSSQVATSPLVSDLDQNGEYEIIFADFTGEIFALNALGEEVLTNLFPFQTGNQIWGSPAMADLNLDGYSDFVIASKDKSLYVFNQNGLVSQYNAESQLIGTPSIGNLDSDSELEVVVGGYSSSGKKIFAINYDGTPVDGFPINVGEKIQRGVALFDFNNNGIDDMVFGTDSDNIYLLYDNGEIAPGFPFEGDDKFRVAPIIIDYNDTPIIIAASKNGTLYAIDNSGNLIFQFASDSAITTSPSVYFVNSEIYILFGNINGEVYAVNLNGNLLNGFPLNFESEIIASIMVSDLNQDDNDELIIVDDSGKLNIITHDLSNYSNSFINYDFSFFSSPSIADIDLDGDLEILVGTVNSLFIADIKEISSENNSWNIFRGNYKRNGYLKYDHCQLGDLNDDSIINVLDIISLINIIIEDILANEFEICAGDFNGDLLLNVQDIIYLVNIIIDDSSN